ncbi:putative protein kinase [Blattamonas nauphoetae]|uniref:Protein kinase domain-containing protein n=1 Tax=Blattamonas nauphoetae TaxID=2049346 RepID=A0ABQ9WS43_9EUKA|nr:putative protein kinase [Blattamonas nauphoetae]
MTERKEDPAVKKPGSSGKIPVNVVKIGQKGKKQPQKLVMSRDGIKCVKKNEDGWNKPPSSISLRLNLFSLYIPLFSSIAPSGSDKKTFTITTLHQQTFEVEDPAIYKRVCDLLKHMGAGMQSLEQSLSQLGVPASAILKSEPQSTKTRPSLRSKASETPANLLSLERLDPSHFVSMSDFELLHCVGKTDTKLYIVMDYVNGGEIFFHLRRARRFPEALAIFYCAEVVSAINHLHKRNIIYRDLKPENVLLDIDGHIVLTDFGLSKIGITSVGGEEGETTLTFCGTPEYLAPEILQNMPHGKAVDWWSTGILFYEMLTGMPPFYSANKQEMFLNTLRAPLTIPDSVSEDARDFLKRSLNRHPEQRLGSGPGEGRRCWITRSSRASTGNSSMRGSCHPVQAARVKVGSSSPFPTSLCLSCFPFRRSFAAQNGIMDISNFDKEFLSLPLTDSPGPVLPEAVLARVNKEFSGWEYNKDVLGSAGKTGRPVPIYPGTAGAPSPKPAAEAPVMKLQARARPLQLKERQR